MTTQGFHVEKSVSIGHIVTTLGLLIGCFWFFAELDKRIAVNEQSIDTLIKKQQTDLNRMQTQRNEDLKRIEGSLDKMDAKLDRLLEQR